MSNCSGGRGWFGGDRGFNYPELTVLALAPGVTYAPGKMTLRPSSPNWPSITTIRQDYSTNELTLDGAASAILMVALYAEETKERKP